MITRNLNRIELYILFNSWLCQFLLASVFERGPRHSLVSDAWTLHSVYDVCETVPNSFSERVFITNLAWKTECRCEVTCFSIPRSTSVVSSLFDGLQYLFLQFKWREWCATTTLVEVVWALSSYRVGMWHSVLFLLWQNPPNKYLSVNAKKAFFRYCQRRQKISRILKLYVQCGIAVL